MLISKNILIGFCNLDISYNIIFKNRGLLFSDEITRTDVSKELVASLDGLASATLFCYFFGFASLDVFKGIHCLFIGYVTVKILYQIFQLPASRSSSSVRFGSSSSSRVYKPSSFCISARTSPAVFLAGFSNLGFFSFFLFSSSSSRKKSL